MSSCNPVCASEFLFTRLYKPPSMPNAPTPTRQKYVEPKIIEEIFYRDI